MKRFILSVMLCVFLVPCLSGLILAADENGKCFNSRNGCANGNQVDCDYHKKKCEGKGC